MKINIFFPFIDKPYGGGNNFLKALKNYFENKGIYSEKPELADAILFNSHHNINKLVNLKKKFPQKTFIHRIDGPVFLIRNNNMMLDKLIYSFNDKIADASIFQSKWSEQKNIEAGIKAKKYKTIIINAPDPEIFNKKNKPEFNKNRKTKIIATSWSANINKGFDTYKFLDENLDFTKYEMTFCGNSPFEFKNIKHIKPLPGRQLAKILKQHDIFITASKNDPCSNALIEAMHCGLPAAALNDGGHPEIIGKGGLTFNKKHEIFEILNKINDNYQQFQTNINLPDIYQTGEKYIKFIQSVYENKTDAKKLSASDKFILHKNILIQKIAKHIIS
ncbi:MAG: glycosyltransferase family 4 protein [Chlorobi bacterium]|nr:glycosyltransferase family 4 protein [Chlorobiota bacterium]